MTVLQVSNEATEDAADVHTFKLETKSAVSSSVNWPIWSTIALILGFVDVSIDCHRLSVLRDAAHTTLWLGEVGTRHRAECAQRRSSGCESADMLLSHTRWMWF